MLCELESNNSSGVDMESRKRCLTSPGTVKKPGDVCATPPAKKLKQARLPFQRISSPPVTQLCSPSPKDRSSKKRKLSETNTDLASPKLSSNKLKDKTNITPSKKKLVTKPPSKKTPGKVKAVKEPEPNPPEVEIEVSSSSEDTVAVVSAAKSPSNKKPTPLDRFLQASQEPTSTSNEEIIDLSAPAGSDDKKDEEAAKSKGKDEKSSSSDTKEVTLIEGSNDGCQETSESKDEDCDNSLVSDEASAAEESALESSTASEASCNTSVDEDKEVKDKDTKPADSASEVSSISSTPKPAPKPPAPKPLSAKAKLKEKEREKKRLEKERLKEEKKQKAEKEREEKRKQKEAAKAERDAKLAEVKRLKEVEREQKAEAKRLRDLEKERKQKEKQAKQEQEEKERDEKDALKMEKQKQKIQELELKNEEKRIKLEEKEEEKKKEEESKLKQQNFFKSFFKKVETPVVPPAPKAEEHCGGFVPFQIQKDMALAPVCGFEKLQEEDAKRKFDNLITSQDTSNLYLDQLKAKVIKPGKRSKTVVEKDTTIENSEDSIQMVEDIKVEKKKKKTKAKLLQFHENYRPAYYGTWSKSSKNITPRNFLKKDEDFLDYEFDSDEEWEEPGESLSDSEGEDSDNDSDGGDSDNDGFFVEHGYLSESEDPVDEDETPEQWRARRKAKALAWEIELKRQQTTLQPIIVGCVWLHGDDNKNQSRFDKTKLEAYRAVTLVTLPIETSQSAKKSPEIMENEDGRSPTPAGVSVKGKVQQKMPVPEEAMPDLLRLVHGNPIGVKSLIREFREYWRLQEQKQSGSPQLSDTTTTKTSTDSSAVRSESPKPSPVTTTADESSTTCSISSNTPGVNLPTEAPSSSPSPVAEVSSTNSTPEEAEKVYTISKRQLEKKIASIAVREKRSKYYARACWYVHEKVLTKYKLTDLPVPTQWEHQTGPLAVNRSDDAPIPYSLLPPQHVTSTPSSSAKRVVPTKVNSPSSVLTMLQHQSSNSARRIVPTKVVDGSSSNQVTNHASLPPTVPIVVDSPSAASMLATAAAAFSAHQKQAANPAAQTSRTVPLPVAPTLVPANLQPIVTASENAPVLVAESQVPEKPAKKVRTLDSFFGGKPKKQIKQKDEKNEPIDNKTVDMEVAEIPSSTVADIDSGKASSKNNAETKMEVDSPGNKAVAKVTPKKENLNVIKDPLSKAKENRLKQASPVRQKPTNICKPSETRKESESLAAAPSEAKDDYEVITLD